MVATNETWNGTAKEKKSRKIKDEKGDDNFITINKFSAVETWVTKIIYANQRGIHECGNLCFVDLR